MSTIIFTGGGTAGHCTPCKALFPYVKKYFSDIRYIGSEKGIERKIIERENIPYYPIPCTKLIRSFSLKNLSIPFKLNAGIRESVKILKEIKPDVIFSKGGYVALPVVIAAHRLGIPVISHESDYTPGLANKISSSLCVKTLTTFPHTAKLLKNGLFVGPPIRKELFETDKRQALKRFGFKGERPVLLITGGSQGAQAINAAFNQCKSDLLPRFDVIHVAGKNNLSHENKDASCLQNANEKGLFSTEFLPDMENALAIADVCVSRAGSNTLFELMSLAIPTVLIPLPKGISRGDQVLNANYFERLGLAYVLSQNALTGQSLSFAVNCAYANRFNIKRNFATNPVKSANEKIADIIAEYRL